jgi:flagella basal body P-ring formation protein FlgA
VLTRILCAFGALLLALPVAALDRDDSHRAVRAAIATAVADRLGGPAAVDVDFLDDSEIPDTATMATPAPGARLGQPIRFTVFTHDGGSHRVVVRTRVVIEHAVARRLVGRDTLLTADDVEWRTEELAGTPLQPLPRLEDVLGSRTRRDVAAGEVLTRSVLVRPPAVRAGDQVMMRIRTGSVEAHGIGRAASSGSIGDVIRVTRTGSRTLRRARIVAAATVEILP